MALKEAEEAGVRVVYLPCRVTRDAIYVDCGSEKIIQGGDWQDGNLIEVGTPVNEQRIFFD